MFDNPQQILQAAADFLPIKMTVAMKTERLKTDLLSQNAKNLTQTFNLNKHKKKQQQMASNLAVEFDMGFN